MGDLIPLNVPLLDLKKQYAQIRAPLDAAIARVVESQHFILGPEVSALEDEIAAYTGVSHAIGMSSGTDALLAALMAVGVGPGDEVITSAYTFFATAGTVARVGATLILVDIDPETYNLDATQVAAAVTDRTRAIVPVHLYGRMADMEPIMSLAASRDITVIEDAAQAIGASDASGRSAGAVGHMAAFSFFPSKNLGGFGDGGMTVTSSEDLAHRLRLLRMHGMEPKYYHAIVGGNFRLDALQAAVLRVKLQYLDQWRDARRRNAERYRFLFDQHGLLDRITLPNDVPGHVYNQFVIRTPFRDRMLARLKEQGIGTEVYYPLPLHMQECFAPLGYREGSMPVSEAAARETLALPIYPELTEEQQAYVVQRIHQNLSEF